MKWLHYLGTFAQLSAMYLCWCYYKQYCQNDHVLNMEFIDFCTPSNIIACSYVGSATT